MGKFGMKTGWLVAMGPAVAGLLALQGCVGSGGGYADRYATACMAEVNPPGRYLWRAGDDRVIGGKFATLEGIEGMNACIERKAAAAGNPMSGGMSTQTTEVEQSGSMVVETYTYGQPPSGVPTSPAAGKGDGQTCRKRDVFSGGSGYYGCVR